MHPDFSKYADGLVPAIIQDAGTGVVLMLGFMNDAAFTKTKTEGRVSFYSRSRDRLWTKGETSGNFLQVQEVLTDCDNDTILVKVYPEGPVCHTGQDTCFNETNTGFSLQRLEAVIADRRQQAPAHSYTASLFAKGINKIAQKVGEEAVELVIESKDENPDRFLDEAADLLFHYLILLQAKDFTLQDVTDRLAKREKKS